MLPRTTKKFIENNKKEKMKTIMFVEYIIETLTVLCTPLLKTVIRSYFFVVGDTFFMCLSVGFGRTDNVVCIFCGFDGR